uniref:Uncharacterized protein n=1 Tax=Aegilops tauschii subsp. strangulata TaxID=200361 RepID=A0A453SDI2_AEGTS
MVEESLLFGSCPLLPLIFLEPKRWSRNNHFSTTHRHD